MKRIAFLCIVLVTLGLGSSATAVHLPSFTGLEAAAGSLPQTAPRAVVAVNLVNAEFTVQQLKYRVFFNKAEVKRIPLNDYDFKAAFQDELMNAIVEDKRMQWRVPTEQENIDVVNVLKKKVALSGVDADRVLLVAVYEYGAFLADLGPDKFYIAAEFKLVDRVTGKKLWHKKTFERTDFDGKLKDMQADNQKGLKEGINRVLEKLVPKIVSDLRLKQI